MATDRVSAAFAAIPRAQFLPAGLRHRAAEDNPLPLGYGSTNSQPWTVAFMLRLLDVRRGMRVLDVGAGSAWTTELLAWLTGPSGEVVGTELVAELVAFGRGNLSSPHARIEQAVQGRLGWPSDAPYDRILVSAMADAPPVALFAQLAHGGRIVFPFGGRIGVATRVRDTVTPHWAPGGFAFVPLR